MNFSSVWTYLKTKRHIFIHLGLALSVALLLQLAYDLNGRDARRKANDWGGGIALDTLQLPESAVAKFKNTISSEEAARIRQQFLECRAKISWHLHLTKDYFVQAYAANSAAYAAGALAALVLFWISKGGWAAANPYLLTIFAVATIGSVLYGTFPVTGKHKENIDANIGAYRQYIEIAKDIACFAATGNGKDGQGTTAAAFLHDVDVRMNSLNTVPVGYDPSKTPDYKQAFPAAGKS